MKYAYYPGCSAHSTARDMHESCLAVAQKLGIELEEIKGWTCCGSSAAHQTDRALAASLASANLVRAKAMGADMVVNCAACYNRSKSANYEVINSAAMRGSVAALLGESYDGSVKVRHFIEVLAQDFGAAKLKKAVKKPLNGLKVACYYGCYLLRPPEVTGMDDPENPTILENIVEAIGGETLEWPGKVECCGGALNLTRTDVTVSRSASIIEMAKSAGAECIAVACPMCQTSLDLRQKDMAKQGKNYNMPVLYVTQLVGLSLGIASSELGCKRLVVPPKAVLKAIKV
ncbi:MAG TPA: CoB--CoM heterodisulfide reductase iron-sulfur subunit B family protein [Dehalococcoidales bacterium]|nr:CoB--CoM heterodisulfide reductase iron-sulfur subunit B family protein [Dehalococcoidales bacterium]